MQNVSREYINSMKSPMRGRGFLEVSIKLGNTYLNYDKKKILSSSYTNAMSPICIELPQDDFVLKIDNSDRTFDLDNPDSPINFLKEGNDVTVRYGYELPNGNIEWLPTRRLVLTDWKADDKTATFNACDPLRLLTEPLPSEKDIVANVPQKPLSQMLQWLVSGTKVKLDLGLTSDPTVKPEFPGLTPKKEAIQMLLNSNCYDVQIVEGDTLRVRPIHKTDKVIKAKPPTSFINADSLSGSLEGMVDGSPKVKYASYSIGYTRVDGSFLVTPMDTTQKYDAGFIEGRLGDDLDKGLAWEGNVKASGLIVEFNSDVIPSELNVQTVSASGTTIKSYKVTGKKMVVIFPKDNYSSIKVGASSFGEHRFSISSAHLINREPVAITKGDMMAYPQAQTEELINTITVEYYDYHFVWENFVNESVTGEHTGQKFKVTYDASPYHKLRVHTGKSSEPYYIVGESKNAYGEEILCTIGPYRVTKITDSAIEMVVTQPIGVNLQIDGYRRETFKYSVTRQINPNGTKDIVWKNPMVTTKAQADKLLNELSEYYKDNVYYEYPTRGNPELESGDIVGQENDYYSDFEVQLCNYTLDFDTSFKGKVKTKRIGGEK